jgi:hypothetical protein
MQRADLTGKETARRLEDVEAEAKGHGYRVVSEKRRNLKESTHVRTVNCRVDRISGTQLVIGSQASVRRDGFKSRGNKESSDTHRQFGIETIEAGSVDLQLKTRLY